MNWGEFERALVCIIARAAYVARLPLNVDLFVIELENQYHARWEEPLPSRPDPFQRLGNGGPHYYERIKRYINSTSRATANTSTPSFADLPDNHPLKVAGSGGHVR